MMAATKTAKRSRLSFWGQLSYFFNRAILNIRQSLLVNLLTVFTISLSILIFSLMFLLYINLEKVTEQWSERVQVTAYFENEVPIAERKTLISRIEALNGTRKVSYVSKQEALQRFRERLRGQEGLVQEVSAEILPVSLEIQLKKEFRSDNGLHSYISQLKQVPGISEVQYGEDWVRRFNNFMDFIKLLSAFIGCFLVLAVIFIVANTIRLTVCSRKDELELLGLVGATRLFIKIPFLIEGVLQGAAGAILAIGLLYALFYGFLHNAGTFVGFTLSESTFVFLPLTYLLELIAGGIALGFIGSLTSLKRFITI